MENMKNEYFVVNTRIKDILGRELINNDNIAIIELIKNAKDARSEKVYISFDDSETPEKGKITVKDFGIGMSYNDITSKWLNMGYSMKRNSKGEQIYAGNKGVGRFSCDRLGKELNLYSTQDGKKGWHLYVNWEDFEKDDINLEFSKVPVKIRECSSDELKIIFGVDNKCSGTILQISNLRNSWDIDDLGRLKKELEKFTVNTSNNLEQNSFDVYLYVSNLSKDANYLNGKIENKIFDALELRTPSIHSSIDESGTIITTTLQLDGNDIFTLKENNTFTKLKNIKISLYHLNKPSKVFFAKKTGSRAIDFGSIFMFLNGFRVFPYGEPDDDWLGLDKRKNQGYGRYFGTRELVGYIKANDKDNALTPVSAREGLVKNDAFIQLTNMTGNNTYKEPGYFYKVMRKLERFVVDGLDWYKVVGDESGNKIPESFFEDKEQKDVQYIPKNREILEALSSVINLQTNKSDIISLEINNHFISSLAEKERNAFNNLKNDLLEKISKDKINNDFFTINADNIVEVVKKQNKINEELKKENIQLKDKIVINEKEIKEKNKEIEEKEGENLFLRATSNKDTDSLLNLMHKIIDDADTITKRINNIIKKKDNSELTEEYLDDFINVISFKTQSILKVAQFATYRNYKMATGYAETDIVSFIKQYIALLIDEKVHDSVLELVDEIPQDLKCVKKVRPLSLSIMVDNIINNSKKARSPKLVISAIADTNKIKLYFADLGEVSNDTDISRVFDKGYTTTNGSGLGLYHVKSFIEEELKGKVQAHNNTPKGFIVELEIKCI